MLGEFRRRDPMNHGDTADRLGAVVQELLDAFENSYWIEYGSHGTAGLGPYRASTNFAGAYRIVRAVDAGNSSCRIQRMHHFVEIGFARGVDECADTIAAGGCETEMPQQKVIEALAFNVQDVARYLVDVGCVHRI